MDPVAGSGCPTFEGYGNTNMSDLDVAKLKAGYGCPGHAGEGCARSVFDATSMALNASDDGCQILVTGGTGGQLVLTFDSFDVRSFVNSDSL